jgi:hypothetical protein
MSLRLPALLAVLGALLLATPSQSQAQPCCGSITPPGQRLATLLDATGVDHLWLASHHVAWAAGEIDQDRPDGREAASHCSAFVAAIAARLGVYVLRPPEHPQELLASAQIRWLRNDGASRGWRALAGCLEAQRAANRGDLVVEAFENPSPRRPGHIAIVRPSDKTLAELDSDGPQETQAGSANAISTTTAAGFRQHRGAWLAGGGGSMAYYAHAIDWSLVK